MFFKLMCFAGLLSGMLGVYAQTAEIPTPTSFQVGDVWEWKRFNNRTKLEEGQQSRTVVKDGDLLVFSNGGGTSQISNAFIGEPSASPWRVWPLEVGKKWKYDAAWQRADGVSGTTKQDVAVVAHEEVVTPAGKFMAFKLEYRGFYSNSRGGSGKQHDIYWYAPEVRADVKHIRDDGSNQYMRELVSFKKGSP